MEDWLTQIAENGGNSVRIFLHHTGEHLLTKYSDDSGFNTDFTHSMIEELKKFLSAAKERNIFVIICLWSGDISANQLFDENYLKSYLDQVLRPMAEALSFHQELGAWDIIDNPEKLVQSGLPDEDQCYDTRNFKYSSAVRPTEKPSMKQILRFIGLHISTLKLISPKKLVTVGLSEEVISLGSCSPCFNYFSDQCFMKASNQPNAVLDFYQIQKIDGSSPIKDLYNEEVDKPVLIGKSTTIDGKRTYVENLIDASFGLYAGMLGWQYNQDDSRTAINQGMKDFNDSNPKEIEIKFDNYFV